MMEAGACSDDVASDQTRTPDGTTTCAATVCIRCGTPQDADALAEIAVEAWRPIRQRQKEMLGAEQFAQQYPDWEATKAAKVRETTGEDFEGSVLVATLGASHAVVGFVSFGPHMWRETGARPHVVGEIWKMGSEHGSGMSLQDGPDLTVAAKHLRALHARGNNRDAGL